MEHTSFIILIVFYLEYIHTNVTFLWKYFDAEVNTYISPVQ